MQQKQQDKDAGTRRWSYFRQVSYIKASLLRQIGKQQLKSLSTKIFLVMKENEQSFKSDKGNMLVVKQAKGYFKGQKVLKFEEQKALKKTGGKFRPVTFVRDKETTKVLKKLAPLIDVPHPDQVGFTNGRSIWDAAGRMAECSAVVNIDLENAFNAIPEQAVYLIFRKVFDLNKTHAQMLTNACCHQGYMFQGSPLSPLIFNLWTRPILDSVKGAGFKVVAYADDLTIGTDCGYISHKMVRVFKKWINQFNMEVNTAKVRFFNHKKPYRETVGLKKWTKAARLVIEPLKFRKTLRKLKYLVHLYQAIGITHTRRLNKAGEPNELGFVILGMWVWISESRRRDLHKEDRNLFKWLSKQVPAVLDDWKTARKGYLNQHFIPTNSIPHFPQEMYTLWEEISTNRIWSDRGRATDEISEKLLATRFRAVRGVDPASTAQKGLRNELLQGRIYNRFENSVNSQRRR